MSSALSKRYCTRTKEYGCILANVIEPLNFTKNRPCINPTQIGNGIVDCYGGLDERNLLTCGDNTLQQCGFDFHYNERQCIPYNFLCEKRCSNNADNLLCDQLPILRSPDCRDRDRADLCYDYQGAYCHDRAIDALYYCDETRPCKY